MWCSTIGQLKAAIAELPDDAPITVLYDGGSGSASGIDVEGILTEKELGWASVGDAVLGI